MLVGVLADERFGPVVACGAGGGTAEVLGDVAVRLAPLAREEALDMIAALRSLALLAARAARDVDALADIAVRVGALADAHPAIAELDLNPVMVGRRGRAGGRRARARRAARRPARLPGGRPMKRIGLLGGMSWESTIEYYRLVNELVAERLGGLHSADCMLRIVDFAEIEVLQREGRWAEAGDAARARGAGARGRRRGAARPVHEHDAQARGRDRAARSRSRSSTSPTRPPPRCAATGSTRVGLLATAYTMEQDFYVGRLREHGLDGARARTRADRRIVHDVIYDELCRRRSSTTRSRDEYRRIMARARRPTARRASCSAAPRSTCWSAPRTRPCRSTTRPACTPSARSSSAWRQTRRRGLPGRRDPRARRQPELAHRGDADLGHQRLTGLQPDAGAAADLGDRDDLGRQVVLGRARRAAGLEHDLPRVEARADRALGGVGA